MTDTPKYRLEATARIASGFVALGIWDERDQRLAQCNTADIDHAAKWANEQILFYEIGNTADVQREIDRAFAALKPAIDGREGLIDATFEVIADGGTAFPCNHGTKDFGPGMSLRDWFAGLAMSAEIRRDMAEEYETVAERAYQHADAMLDARNKKAD
jgi:hypothetical protein